MIESVSQYVLSSLIKFLAFHIDKVYLFVSFPLLYLAIIDRRWQTTSTIIKKQVLTFDLDSYMQIVCSERHILNEILSSFMERYQIQGSNACFPQILQQINFLRKTKI